MKSNTIYRVLGIMGGLYGVTLLALLTLLFIDLSGNAEDFANPEIEFFVFALVLLLGGSANDVLVGGIIWREQFRDFSPSHAAA